MADCDCQQSQWASLPEHILNLITDRIISLHDLLSFSCVCSSWRSASPAFILRMNTIPWLIVPYEGYTCQIATSIWNDTLGFYTPFRGDDDDFKATEKVYKVHLPEIADRRICGSTQGWLVTVHENSEMKLLNPISRAIVNLPPLTQFPGFLRTEFSDEGGLIYFVMASREIADLESSHFREFCIQKVVANSSSTTICSEDGFPGRRTSMVVMAIHSSTRQLAWYRPGVDEEKWSSVEGEIVGFYEDVVFYKGEFYAVTHAGNVVVVRGLDGPSRPYTETLIFENDYYADIHYLVEYSGELLKVLRVIDRDAPVGYKTMGFKVKKLDTSGLKAKWVELKSIHDHALFIGYNNSFSCLASDIPGCRANCIYFTDNNWECFFRKPYGGHDIGIYNLEDGTFDAIYATPTEPQLILPPPLWFVSTKS